MVRQLFCPVHNKYEEVYSDTAAVLAVCCDKMRPIDLSTGVLTNPDNADIQSFQTIDTGNKKEFSTGMQRNVSAGKPRYDLVYMPMLKRWAELLARGGMIYGDRNWEKAETQEELDRFLESAWRHFVQWANGETDEDHAAAVFFNISGAEMVKKKLEKKCANPK